MQFQQNLSVQLFKFRAKRLNPSVSAICYNESLRQRQGSSQFM
jgi:hypothetical protein